MRPIVDNDTMPAAIKELCLKGDKVSQELIEEIGFVPANWGRMDAASRILIVSVGMLKKRISQNAFPEETALILGTHLGCTWVDRQFWEGLSKGLDEASPHLFAFTLPNIPVSEVAIHYGIKGPVYAVIDEKAPMEKAMQEARACLSGMPFISLVITGHFDIEPESKFVDFGLMVITR